jgi:exopolysaccharide biosynthesis polyprenyl glycosylphosphotransferase
VHPRRLLTPLLLVLSDLIAVNLAFFAAWYLRYERQVGGDVEPFDFVGYDVYLPLGLLLSVLVVTIFQFGSLYRTEQAAFWFTDLFAILGRCGFAAMTLFAFSTMIRYPASSRLTFVLSWVMATICVALGRLVVQSFTAALHRRGIGTERVVVVGENSLGRMVMQGIAARPHLGLQVVGFVGVERADDFGRFRHLGSVDEIDQVVKGSAIDQVIIALPSTSHELQLRIVEHCRQAGVRFKLVPDLFEMSLSRIDLDTVSGIPLIGLKEVSIEGRDLFVKRSLDLLLTSIALVPLSVVMLAVAFLVMLDSRGPIIYRQTRVGKHGRLFTIYKFRSMRVGADRELEQLMPFNDQDGPIFKKRDDPRMTRAGRIIRRASLDELPQLLNVLKGDMSLVGPRPPLPAEVERYEAWHRKRLQVAPGLTGLWQVSGRSSVNFEEMVVFDLAYIQNWSLSLDLSILLRTIPAVITGGGAF